MVQFHCFSININVHLASFFFFCKKRKGVKKKKKKRFKIDISLIQWWRFNERHNGVHLFWHWTTEIQKGEKSSHCIGTNNQFVPASATQTKHRPEGSPQTHTGRGKTKRKNKKKRIEKKKIIAQQRRGNKTVHCTKVKQRHYFAFLLHTNVQSEDKYMQRDNMMRMKWFSFFTVLLHKDLAHIFFF